MEYIIFHITFSILLQNSGLESQMASNWMPPWKRSVPWICRRRLSFPHVFNVALVASSEPSLTENAEALYNLYIEPIQQFLPKVKAFFPTNAREAKPLMIPLDAKAKIFEQWVKNGKKDYHTLPPPQHLLVRSPSHLCIFIGSLKIISCSSPLRSIVWASSVITFNLAGKMNIMSTDAVSDLNPFWQTKRICFISWDPW